MHSLRRTIILASFLLVWQVSEASPMRVGKILIEGNRVTKEDVIRREIRLREGETYADSEFRNAVEESKQNLMNTALFNFVEVDVEGEDLMIVTFRLTERWYLWPAPVFIYEDRNFSSWLEKGDLSRLSYGLLISHHNLFGRRQLLDITAQWGYNRQVLMRYRHNGLDSLRRFGMEMQAGYTSLHEMAYALGGGKELFLRDVSEPVYSRRYALLSLIYRPGLHGSLEAGLGIEDLNWSDTLLQLNPGFSSGGQSRSAFMKFRLKLKLDHRDYASYPLRGWYSDFELLKHGFGQGEGNPDEFQVNLGIRRFISPLDRIYLALGYQGRMSAAGPRPFYLGHALGYSRDFVRGYELYVVDGQNFSLFKSNLRYELLPKTHVSLPGFRKDYFRKSFLAAYLCLHADAAYVSDHYQGAGNTLANQWLFGYGGGLDLVSYYDLVLRLEYSVNRLKEGTFNIHFMAPI